MEMKHKIVVSEDEGLNRLWHETFTRSVRSKVLQKLILLWFNLWIDQESELHQLVKKRILGRGLPLVRGNFIYEVKPEEAMEILGCSKRTAIEYLNTLRILFL
jgi:hypothetical protein